MVAAGNLIRATDLNNLVTPYYVATAVATTWNTGSGNVRQNVAGLTFDVVTINPDAVVDVTWTIDFLVTTAVAGGNFQFRLEVDGIAQAPLAIKSTTSVTRDTAPQSMQVVHALPGTYTYQISGIATSATAAGSAGTAGTTMRAICIDLAA